MKILLQIATSAFAMLNICSCSTEQSKLNEEAQHRAIEAASVVIAVDSVKPVDSIALQSAILDAKSIQSEYIIAGNEEASKEFDKAFRNTIIERNPQLGSLIFGNITKAE